MTQLPETTDLIAKAPRVQNSTQSPCWQQRQIAAQNSYFHSIEQKKVIVYKAPCDIDKPKQEAPQKVAVSNG